MPPQPVIEGRLVSWYVATIGTRDIPIWRWDEIDAGDWAVIQAVQTEFHGGVEEAKAERRSGRTD